MSLATWLSGSAVVIASTTFGAPLSVGLKWATINGLALPHPLATQAARRIVDNLTASRVDNLVDTKKRLYTNKPVGFSTLAPGGVNWGDPGTSTMSGGFPLPFVIHSLMEKHYIVLSEPKFSLGEASLDKGDEDTSPAYSAQQPDWAFLPWHTSTVDWATRAFGFTSNAPQRAWPLSRSATSLLA
ncbi:hypothetical protein MTO96_029630 [Rhipicephalus appendiculatus]